MKVGEVIIPFKAKVDGLNKGFKSAENSLKSFAEKTKRTATTLRRMGTGLSIFGGATLFTLKKVIDTYGVQEQAEARLIQQMKNHHEATAQNIKALKDLAAARQKVTTFSDEETISAMAMLASFRLNHKEIAMLTPALQDLATMTAKTTGSQADMESSAKLLGLALEGQAGRLRQAGISLSDEEAALLKAADRHGKVVILMKILAENAGGLAVAVGKTATGGIKQLTNAMSDLVEMLGNTLTPTIRSLIPKIRDIITSVQEWVKSHPELIGQILKTTAVIGALTVVVGPLLLVFSTLMSMLASLTTMFVAFSGGATGASASLAGISGAATLAAPEVMVLVGAITALVMGYLKLKSAVKEANKAQDQNLRMQKQVTNRMKEGFALFKKYSTIEVRSITDRKKAYNEIDKAVKDLYTAQARASSEGKTKIQAEIDVLKSKRAELWGLMKAEELNLNLQQKGAEIAKKTNENIKSQVDETSGLIDKLMKKINLPSITLPTAPMPALAGTEYKTIGQRIAEQQAEFAKMFIGARSSTATINIQALDPEALTESQKEKIANTIGESIKQQEAGR